MLILILFSFLAGVVTILSPCILPVLPIILSGAVGKGKRKPLGIASGFVLSFSFFTLALSALVRTSGISANALRAASIVILGILGLFLLVPSLQILFEKAASRLVPQSGAGKTGQGFLSGLVTGFSLGLIWTPCVGPIMAAVITLAASSSVNVSAVFITAAYSLGTAVPMLAVMSGGKKILYGIPWLSARAAAVQKFFGVVMILMAFVLYQGYDRAFQNWVLARFPQYGTGLTAIENNENVRRAIDGLFGREPLLTENPPAADGSVVYPAAPEIVPGGEWFNTKPLSLAGLKGKVVLIDFWTYTCINCIRTLPYLNAWHERYADKGLVIIGVHTPEFEFEKEAANVSKAVRDFKINYAVMQDNNYETWNAYSNRYWPAKYFIDKEGRVRGSHFGEGDYGESEEMIRRLLKESGSDPGAFEKLEDYQLESRTPETYLGFARAEGFASVESFTPGTMSYTAPAALHMNHFAYEGEWSVDREFSVPSPGAGLHFRFTAKDVFLVMRPLAEGPSEVEVYIDGKPAAEGTAGKDVRGGMVLVDEDRLYHLASFSQNGGHHLTLKFRKRGPALFAFTFG